MIAKSHPCFFKFYDCQLVAYTLYLSTRIAMLMTLFCESCQIINGVCNKTNSKKKHDVTQLASMVIVERQL